MEVRNDQYYYRFTPQRHANYVAYTRGATATRGELYDESFNRLTLDNNQSGGGGNFRIAHPLAAGKTYYVLVRGEPGGYALHIDGPESLYSAVKVKPGAEAPRDAGREATGTVVTPVRTAGDSSSAEVQGRIARYQAQFRDGRFLLEGDSPNWLAGQCVAWAKQVFDVGSSVPISGISVGTAAKIPSVLSAYGFEIGTNAEHPEVGALIVWEDGGSGHVGVVTEVVRDSVSQKALAITVSEANYGRVTAAGAAQWGIDLEVAKREIVTEEYGVFRERRFEIGNLNRDSYRFTAYVYPR